MQSAPQLRDQVRSLSIPREQRPGEGAAQRARGPRWGITVVLAVLVLGLSGYVAWDKLGDRIPYLSRSATSATAAVRLITVAAQPATADAAPVLTATGKIVSDHQVEVATKVSGQVVALHFEQGDHVQQGQLLAEIDDEGPRARRDEAAARLARARADLAYQETNFARVERLFRDRQASDIELADARRALEMARAELAAGEATLAYVEKILRDCRVTAPISGVVLERNVEVGDFVAAEGGRGAMANAQFGSIADMTKLRVEVDVSELDVHRLRRGLPCAIVPDAHKNRRYQGHVLWLDPGANYAKATVQVKVRIENPDDYLRVDGAAQVQFLTAEPTTSGAPAAGGIWVPRAACRLDAGGHTGKVFVAVDGRFKETAVTLGRAEGDRVEVLAGLTAGQEIAADGAEHLRDGQPVRR